MAKLLWRPCPPRAVAAVGQRACYLIVPRGASAWLLSVCELGSLDEIASVPLTRSGLAMGVAQHLEDHSSAALRCGTRDSKRVRRAATAALALDLARE